MLVWLFWMTRKSALAFKRRILSSLSSLLSLISKSQIFSLLDSCLFGMIPVLDLAAKSAASTSCSSQMMNSFSTYVVDPWLCCGSCAYNNTDKAIMAKMNSGLMIDFMGM